MRKKSYTNFVVDFNPLSTNPAVLQPKNQFFYINQKQPDGYNPLNFYVHNTIYKGQGNF